MVGQVSLQRVVDGARQALLCTIVHSMLLDDLLVGDSTQDAEELFALMQELRFAQDDRCVAKGMLDEVHRVEAKSVT